MEVLLKDGFLYELQEFNVFVTDTEHSASFIYFELLQVSAVVQASQSGSRFSDRFKVLFFLFFSSSNKNIWVCSTPPLMSSTCKHLVYLEGR